MCNDGDETLENEIKYETEMSGKDKQEETTGEIQDNGVECFNGECEESDGDVEKGGDDQGVENKGKMEMEWRC